MNENENAQTISGLEHLSHSRISSFLTCGLKWKFHYVDRLRPEFTPAALAFGVAFHEAAEEALAGLMVDAAPGVPQLVAVVARSLDEQNADVPIQFADEGGKDAMLELATRMLTAWIAWPRPPARILAVEQDFELSLAPGLPPLVGRIDIIEEHEDHVLVIDVKTSAKKWSTQQVDEHAPQLILYGHAVKKLAAELGKPVRMAYEVITKTKVPTVERYSIEQTTDSIERQAKIAGLVVSAVKTGIFIPQPGWQCATCPYAGPCREWSRNAGVEAEPTGPIALAVGK